MNNNRFFFFSKKQQEVKTSPSESERNTAVQAQAQTSSTPTLLLDHQSFYDIIKTPVHNLDNRSPDTLQIKDLVVNRNLIPKDFANSQEDSALTIKTQIIEDHTEALEGKANFTVSNQNFSSGLHSVNSMPLLLKLDQNQSFVKRSFPSHQSFDTNHLKKPKVDVHPPEKIYDTETSINSSRKDSKDNRGQSGECMLAGNTSSTKRTELNVNEISGDLILLMDLMEQDKYQFSQHNKMAQHYASSILKKCKKIKKLVNSITGINSYSSNFKPSYAKTLLSSSDSDSSRDLKGALASKNFSSQSDSNPRKNLEESFNKTVKSSPPVSDNNRQQNNRSSLDISDGSDNSNNSDFSSEGEAKYSSARRNNLNTSRQIFKDSNHSFSSTPEKKVELKYTDKSSDSKNNPRSVPDVDSVKSTMPISSIAKPPNVNDFKLEPNPISTSMKGITIVATNKKVNNIDLSSKSQREVLYDCNSKFFKIFKRKPRGLIVSKFSTKGSTENPLAVSGSLDGTVQFWHANSQSLFGKGEVHLSPTQYPEHISMVSPNAVCVSLAKLSSDASNSLPKINENLALMALISIRPKKSDKSIYKVNYINQTGVDRNIFTTTPITTQGLCSNQRTVFVSGGLDKKLDLWDIGFSSEFDHHINRIVHIPSYHSSSIYSVAFDPSRAYLFSGGTDCRLQITDLNTNSAFSTHKYSERINNLIMHPQNPNVLMLNYASTNKQFRFIDLRAPLYIPRTALEFGFQSEKNQSRYMVPSFHPAGNFVVSGLHDTSEGEGGLFLWDIRFTKADTTTPQCLAIHSKRVVGSQFIPGKKNTLVTISSDNSMAFTDFKTALSNA